MATETTTRTFRLNGAQLRGLLGNRTCTHLSPLTLNTAGKASPEERRALEKAGLLDAAGNVPSPWNGAMDVLAAPGIEILVAAGTRDGLQALHTYGSPSQGMTLTGYTPRGENEHTLAYPLSRTDLLAYLASILGWENKVADLGVALECNATAWVALVGLLDAERELQLDAMLAREPYDAAGVRAERILVNVREGWLVDDFRWLVSMARRMSPSADMPDAESIGEGLKELEGLGWIEGRPDGRWTIRASMATAAAHLQTPLAFGVLVLQSLMQDQLERSLHVGWIRGLGSLWMVDFRQDNKTQLRVGLRSLDGATAARATNEVLEWACARTAAAIQPSPIHAASPKPAPRFCSGCGTPLVESARFCAQCGTKILR